jgi:nicotinate phosphoribosyltransferase
MSYGYWKEGIAERESVFNLFFRNNPFGSGYTISCGLSYVIDFLKNFKFTIQDIDFLRSIKTASGSKMFDQEFLDYLFKLKFTCSLDAIPEGRAVFPHEPMVRVQGPILQCQLMETALLNMINYQSLVATKASRICSAARDENVLEFGMRRAQGIDGALSASRAAYIGGCSSTSNLLAGKLFGIPVSGTHAHSWVMAFDSELEAFKSYAHALPDNCIFLIDTYDTIQGANHAVEVGKMLKEKGKSLLGVRIDSGDLAYFSNKVRSILDKNGFKKTKIVASNNLDEHIIASLKEQKAAIEVWGVGTKLATAFDQPALGGVYKLAAIKSGATWEYKIKLTEQAIKVNNPGIQQIRRFRSNDGLYTGDMIYDINTDIGTEHLMIDPFDHTRRKEINSSQSQYEDILVPIFRAGELVYAEPDIHTIRASVSKELNHLDKGIKRFVNPHTYSVGLEKSLFDCKTELIFHLRNLK